MKIPSSAEFNRYDAHSQIGAGGTSEIYLSQRTDRIS